MIHSQDPACADEVPRGIDGPVPDQLELAEPPPDREGARELAEYPDSESFTPALRFRHGGAGRQIERIVIHITCGQADYRRTVRYFQNPTRDGQPVYASAHYVVGQGGQVVQMVRHQDIAYHAGHANSGSIGIEHVARPPREWGHSDPGFPPTLEQYQASARLVRFLAEQHQVPLDREHVLGHAEADHGTTHENCPNGAWDWDLYMQLLWDGV